MTRRWGSKQISGRKARGSLASLLYGCSDERLAAFTAEGLARQFNVVLPVAEQMLAKAREARAG